MSCSVVTAALSRSLLAVAAALLLVPGSAQAIGILVPTQPGLPALRLVHHRVEVNITERGATTKVTQEFDNPTGQQLEATYLFPLPKGATVDEFALWMNGKRETGKVMERGQARAIYESIVRRARDPGLIEYVDAELFQARVFPIPPNGRQKIELIYSHLVEYEGGVHRYVYPLKTDAQASSTLEDFTLTVHIKNKLPIKNLTSPTHQVATRVRGNQGDVGFERNAFSLSENFALYWTVDDKDVGLTVLTYKDADEPGYFMFLASPKDDFRDKEIIGKRVSFVVDTSGSMAGEKMDAVRDALDYCLQNLGEDDMFNIVPFGSYVETFSDKMVAASSANVARARTFVKQMEAMGGTNISEALNTALKAASGSKKAPHMVVFLTDGRPTVGDTEVASILGGVNKNNADSAHIFVFGVGGDVNTTLLDKLAEGNSGRATYLKGDASLRAEVTAFFDQVSHPVMSNLKLNIDGVRTFGLHPQRVPDLFKGGQLVVLGRYRDGGRAKVTLTGTTPRGQSSFSYSADFAGGGTEHGFIPRLWAQRQVGMLLAEIREKGESRGLVDEVTQLATRFGIVTPYTSYLVVEPGFDQGMVRDARPRPEPRPDMASRRGDDESFSVFAPSAAPAEMEEAGPTGGSGVRVARPKASAPAREAMKKESGDSAVAASKAIGRLRDGSVASDRKVATSVARALGRSFRFDGGFYVDEKSAAKDQQLSIKPYSDAYFAALKLRPDLKQAFMLGERVKISVGKGRTLVIAPDGKDKVGADELKKFLAK